MQSNPYLMDEFSDNYGAGSSDNIQMWLFNDIFSSGEILTKAQKFFRNEGYSLKLEGEYNDKYSELLPTWIQE
jgi:hypothetical protein